MLGHEENGLELRVDETFCIRGASLVAQGLKHLPAMRETWVQFLGQEDPLEKEMATHSSILAWRIPWTEEPGGLSPRGHKESDSTQRLHFHFLLLQTLPVGSLVLSVLATDKDTGSAGAVVYSIEKVRVYGPRGSVGAAAPRGHQGAASPTQPAGTLQPRS